MNVEEIDKAIGAHGMWKARLGSAIDTGRSDTTPEQVEPDNLCAFGKWLNALPATEHGSEHYKKVRSLHAAFHKEAAKVLRLATSGKKAEAKQSLDSGGSYATASANLTSAMMGWKKSIRA